MQRLLIESYELIEVPSAFKNKKHMAMLEAVRRFIKGEALGLTPELEASTELKKGNMRAGQLVYLLAKTNPKGKIQPVYAVSSGNQLSLNIGVARLIGDFADLNNQVTADRLMIEIGKLCQVRINN